MLHILDGVLFTLLLMFSIHKTRDNNEIIMNETFFDGFICWVLTISFFLLFIVAPLNVVDVIKMMNFTL